MLNCAEQVQIQKYKTHAYKTLKAVGVQLSIKKEITHETHIPYQRTQKTNHTK